MKRVAAVLACLAGLWGLSGLSMVGLYGRAHLPGTAHASDLAQGFTPPARKFEKPYTNESCLTNCHALPGVGAGSATGVLRSLHVDWQGYLASTHGQKGIECVDCHADADPNFHPRTGYARVDCRACHAQRPPEGVFPPDALKRLEAKGIKAPPKETWKAETWAKTKHGRAWEAGNPAAPACAHCHTAHYQRPSVDPASTVHRRNLSATCGLCHVDQVRSYDVGGALARFRLGGHGKGDLSNRYAVSECLGCHQGEGAHGEETVTGQTCPTCHRVPAEPRDVAWTSFHIRPQAADQPLARALRWGYAALFWGAVGVAGLVVVFLGFSTLYRRSDG